MVPDEESPKGGDVKGYVRKERRKEGGKKCKVVGNAFNSPQ